MLPQVTPDTFVAYRTYTTWTDTYYRQTGPSKDSPAAAEIERGLSL